MKAFGFGKAEKLKSRKQIEVLFAAGKSIAKAPVRAKYLVLPLTEGAPVQAGVSVGRRAFKRAIDRNRIKRLLREAYRLQKAPLLTVVKEKGIHLIVFFIYTDKTIASFDVIHNAMARCLAQLQQKIVHHENPR
jgi:ribonuclease P protein component